MTLDRLQVGQRGVIECVSGEDSLTARIMEMGVTPGAPFVMIGVAPLGDPIEIEILNYRLSLRRSEARRIAVQLDDRIC
jgi:ferrous iron transport protein A